MTKTKNSIFFKEYNKRIVRDAFQYSIDEYERFAKRYKRLYGDFLPNDRNARILDVGCGGGHFLFFLKKEGYRNFTGIDQSQDQVERCNQIINNAAYHTTTIEWLNKHYQSYDAIILNHVIEHLDSDEELIATLQALYNSLMPAGKLIITTPNACTPWAGYNLFHDLTHHRLFSDESLSQLLSLLNFEVSFYPESAIGFDFFSSLRWGMWKVREFFLKFSFFIEFGTGRWQRKKIIVSPGIIAVCVKRTTDAHEG